MKCHLVYSIPFEGQPAYMLLQNKIRRRLLRFGLPVRLMFDRQPGEAGFVSWPVQSPFENTRNLYTAISRKMPTRLYHLTERVRCNFQKDDVFLGHPYFPHREGQYGITEIAAGESQRPRIFALISPLHCDVSTDRTHITKEFLDDVSRLLPHADVLFGIMGEYWWDQWDSSPYAAWKSKMIRLDMAVNIRHYPRVKRSFNPPGHRGYLYIGKNEPRKGIELFRQLMDQIGDYPKGWIGSGPEIPGVPRISIYASLDPEFMSGIAKDFDFFISPSKADPNPTTILESMAWGFPVVCTPQSGYYETWYRPNIFWDNIPKSINVLKHLQFAEETELLKMAEESRRVVETDYTWDKFTATVIAHLGIQ